MMIALDKFDTEILSVPCYKATINDLDNVRVLERDVQSLNLGFITCFAPFGVETSKQLTALGFSLISLRCLYEHRSSSLLGQKSKPILIWSQLESPKIITEDSWDAVVSPVASLSRYAQDAQLGIIAATKIYRKWLENSLHGYASQVYCAEVGGQLAGFITLKEKDGDIFIDLLSVAADFQSQGVGSALVRHVLSEIGSTKMLKVITEGENIAANRLYQQSGFRVESLQMVYHLHV